METLDLRMLLRPLRRWWWLILAATFLAAFSSLVYSLRQPAVYQSRTTLIVGSTIRDPNPNGGDVFLTQQLAQTYTQMAQREPIKLATMQALGMEWLPYYSVFSASQIIEIQVYAQDPTLARDVAAELAEQLILLGPAGREQQEREDFIDSQLAELQTGILDTKEEIRQKQQGLAVLYSAREIANTQSLIQALDSKVSTLQANYAALLATTQQGAANTLSILEPANLPTTPVDSNLPTNVLVAALLGCVLAICGTYLIEFLDDTFKAADEAQEVFNAPILTSIPMVRSGTDESKLVMLQTTPEPSMEAYRLLRVNLEFTAVDHPLRLLLVTGTSPNDGKSLTAANMALIYARAGRSVILLDGDLHRPALQRLFKLNNNVGLTTALRNAEVSLETLLQPTIIPGVRILTTGPLPPNPAELVGSIPMKRILSELKDMADLVIIDSPPLTTVTDAIVLAMQADGVLMVVRAGQTRRALARRACSLLNQVNIRPLGIAYNGVAVKDSQYQYDYGYYQYRHRKDEFPRSASTTSPTLPEPAVRPQQSAGVSPFTRFRPKQVKERGNIS